MGSMTLLGAGRMPSGVTYTGPGDVNGAAYAWYGLRGFSAAYSTGSNPAIDIVDSSGANTTTINILSTGAIDNAAITTFVGLHGTASVAKFYDQISTRHITQATVARMPTITQNAIGSLPAMTFAGSQALLTGSAVSVSTPFTVSGIYTRTGAGGDTLLYDDNNGLELRALSNQLVLNSAIFAASADNSFHAVQALWNNPSITSALYIDGTNTQNDSGNTFAFNGHLCLGGRDSTGSNGFTGKVCEIGIWAADKSANNSAMNSNQHTYWGF